MTYRAKESSRRRFIKMGLAGAAAVPLANVLVGRLSHAEDMPKLDENDAQAKSLKYSHDGSTATAEDQTCANCQLYAETEGGWGTCTLFPGKLVAGEGWCAAWAKKTG